MNIYAISCNTFGRKFSFNAKDMMEAIDKAKGWCLYHSFNFNEEYKVEEISEENSSDLHNEYVRNK